MTLKSTTGYSLMHVALWAPLLIATPLFIAMKNPDDITIPIPFLMIVLAVLTGLVSCASIGLAKLAGLKWYWRISVMLLAVALVLVIQGNFIHELFSYGEFNGERVNWRSYEWQFWLEGWAFFIAIPLIASVLFWATRLATLVAWLPLLSAALLVIPAIGAHLNRSEAKSDSFDKTVFEFSRQRNLIHLLPDGLQGDIVKEVLETNPALAEQFTGFTLFASHLGMYQGTAPSVPAIFNGRPFGLERGHDYSRTMSEIREFAYQNELDTAGYRLDFVSLATPYCLDQAQTCVIRPFNDLKPRGYYRHRNENWLYALRLIADLSLFRHVPMLLKELIYNDGDWLLSDTTADGSSPFPDPVIREWNEHIKVVDGPPRYKWYHYIGTHIPAQWDEQCRFLRDMAHTRDNYKKQTYCVLNGIARFLAKLKEVGIYDQTAMVITGDHGCNIPPYDLKGSPKNAGLSAGLIGTARPAFLMKQLNNQEPFRISKAMSSMLDIAPTALELVGLRRDFKGVSALTLAPSHRRKRVFRRYVSSQFWTGKPVPYDEYEVSGRPNEAEDWQLTGMFRPEEAPGEYQRISKESLQSFIRGASLTGDRANPQIWIRSNELAFLIRHNKPSTHHTLKLKVHIPKYIGEQRGHLLVNGHLVANDIRLASTAEFWQQLEVPVAGETLISGNNFLRLHFENVASPPGNRSFKTSGMIGAIALK